MDIKLVRRRAETLREQIERQGLFSIFGEYEPRDKAGNYLKAKILGQLHTTHRGTTSDDAQNLAFLRHEEGCEQVLPSPKQVEIYTKQTEFYYDQSSLLTDICSYYSASWINSLLNQLDDQALDELVGQMPQKDDYNMNFDKEKYKEDVKTYKERLKEIKRIKKQFPDIYKSLVERLNLTSDDIKKLEQENPEACELAKNMTDSCLSLQLGRLFGSNNECRDLKQLLQQRPNKMNVEFLQILCDELMGENVDIKMNYINHCEYPLKHLEDATILSQIMLSVYELEGGLSFEELLSKIREPLSKSVNDEIKTEYRDYKLLHESRDGNRIGENACLPEEIPDAMKKLSEKYASIDWSKLSEEEAVAKSAELSWDFVCIHPYVDGNGRTSRMLMEYVLSSHDIVPPSICYGMDTKTEYNLILNKCEKDDSAIFQKWLVQKFKEQGLESSNKEKQEEMGA